LEKPADRRIPHAMTPLAPPHLEIPAATPISPTQTVDPG